MGIFSWLMAKSADKIANASHLAKKQIEEIDKKKQAYLSEKNSNEPHGKDAQELISRMLGTIGVEIYHAYLSQIKNIYKPIKTTSDRFDVENRVAYFDITKWVLNTEENYLDKLVNVYHVLSDAECSIALIFHRKTTICTVTMAIVNNTSESDRSVVSSYRDGLKATISGNFPGVVFLNLILPTPKQRKILVKLSFFRKKNSIASPKVV